MSSKKLNTTQALNLARQLARSGEVYFSKHAEVELKNDDLDRSDAISVLCSPDSRIIKQPELKGDDWTYRVETKKICVVIKFIELEDGLIVITVFKLKRL